MESQWTLSLCADDISFENGWRTPNSYCEDFAVPPTRQGVYAFVYAPTMPNQAPRVLYVGMSKNLKQRLSNHPTHVECSKRFDFVRIHFKEMSGDIRKWERILIKSFNPPYNLQNRVRGE